MKHSPVWPLLSAVLILGTGSVVHAQSAVPAAEAKEPEGVIVGDPIPRSDGRWFGLTMVGPKLQLNFYDDNKQPEKVDRIRAVLKIDPPGRKSERDVMNPTSDGLALVCNKPIRAPWVFKVIITLIDEDENAAETLVVNFNRIEADEETEQAMAEAPEAAVKTEPAPVVPAERSSVY